MVRVQTGLRTCLSRVLKSIGLPSVPLKSPAVTRAVLVSNGFSGNVMVLLSKQAVPSYIDRLEEYEHIFKFQPNGIS